MSNDTKPRRAVVVIKAKVPKPEGGFDVVEIEPRGVAIGDFLAGGPDDLTRDSFELTRTNLKDIGVMKPRLRFPVADHLSGLDNKEFDLDVTFTSPTPFWIKRLLATVPYLRSLKIALDSLVEAKRDPILRNKLAAALLGNAEGSPAALENGSATEHRAISS